MDCNNVDENSTPWGWIVAGVSAVISTLTSAVAFLFRGQIKLYETRIGQLDEEVLRLSDASEKCQEEHTNTKIELASLKGRMETLEKLQK